MRVSTCAFAIASGPRFAVAQRVVRYLIAILSIVVVLGALAAVKGSQIASLMAFGKKAQAAGPPPEAVGVAPATEQLWEETIDSVGSVESSKGVAVSNESPGVVMKIHFESGATVEKGQLLVELDTRVERAQLASVVANEKLAKVNNERTGALFKEGAVPKADFDATQSQLNATAANAASLQALVDRKVVRAPFAGRLGIRAVNLGQYLAPGTAITTLEAIDTVFVDFTVPQQRLGDLSVGMPVRVHVGASGDKPIEGTIAAVDPTLEASTRAIRVRASIPNEGEKLRPGMFVDVAVILPTRASLVTVPSTAIIHASYGDSVFIVEDKKPEDPGARQTEDGKPIQVVRQQFVKTGRRRGDFVQVVEGLPVGSIVVGTGAFKLRNGAPVVVTETAITKPELDPRPPNR